MFKRESRKWFYDQVLDAGFEHEDDADFRHRYRNGSPDRINTLQYGRSLWAELPILAGRFLLMRRGSISYLQCENHWGSVLSLCANKPYIATKRAGVHVIRLSVRGGRTYMTSFSPDQKNTLMAVSDVFGRISVFLQDEKPGNAMTLLRALHDMTQVGVHHPVEFELKEGVHIAVTSA